MRREEVRVVRRAGDQREERPGRGVDRDDGPAAAGQAVEGGLLGLRARRRDGSLQGPARHP